MICCVFSKDAPQLTSWLVLVLQHSDGPYRVTRVVTLAIVTSWSPFKDLAVFVFWKTVFFEPNRNVPLDLALHRIGCVTGTRTTWCRIESRHAGGPPTTDERWLTKSLFYISGGWPDSFFCAIIRSKIWNVWYFSHPFQKNERAKKFSTILILQ